MLTIFWKMQRIPEGNDFFIKFAKFQLLHPQYIEIIKHRRCLPYMKMLLGGRWRIRAKRLKTKLNFVRDAKVMIKRI